MVFYMLSPENKYFSTLTKKTSDLLSRFWGIDKIVRYLPSRYSPKVKWLALAERWYLTPYLPILWYKCGHVKHRSTKATVLVFVVCYLLPIQHMTLPDSPIFSPPLSFELGGVVFPIFSSYVIWWMVVLNLSLFFVVDVLCVLASKIKVYLETWNFRFMW